MSIRFSSSCGAQRSADRGDHDRRDPHLPASAEAGPVLLVDGDGDPGGVRTRRNPDRSGLRGDARAAAASSRRSRRSPTSCAARSGARSTGHLARRPRSAPAGGGRLRAERRTRPSRRTTFARSHRGRDAGRSSRSSRPEGASARDAVRGSEAPGAAVRRPPNASRRPSGDWATKRSNGSSGSGPIPPSRDRPGWPSTRARSTSWPREE